MTARHDKATEGRYTMDEGAIIPTDAPAHEFVGRRDRWCEVCNLPDRHPVHVTATAGRTEVAEVLPGGHACLCTHDTKFSYVCCETRKGCCCAEEAGVAQRPLPGPTTAPASCASGGESEHPLAPDRRERDSERDRLDAQMAELEAELQELRDEYMTEAGERTATEADRNRLLDAFRAGVDAHAAAEARVAYLEAGIGALQTTVARQLTPLDVAVTHIQILRRKSDDYSPQERDNVAAIVETHASEARSALFAALARPREQQEPQT